MALVVALMLAAAANAAGPPARVGQCAWVHGRFAVYNGSSIQRIWVIGTRRIIALSDYDKQVPPEIRRFEREEVDLMDVNDRLLGDFYVCALERSRPGHMQHVRLLRTRNLIFRGKPFASR